jgi:hypothetical protein
MHLHFAESFPQDMEEIALAMEALLQVETVATDQRFSL